MNNIDKLKEGLRVCVSLKALFDCFTEDECSNGCIELSNGYIEKLSDGKYSVSYNKRNLGKFDSIEDAEMAHYKAKKEAIYEVAEEYKKIIPNKVYEALISWS